MDKRSVGQKRRWEKIPKEERSTIARELGKLRWAKISKQKRKEHAMKMVKAKINNKIK